MFCVRVISAEPTPWGGEVTRDGRLNLVDLSGSENIKRSGAVGARAKEAAAIGQVLCRSCPSGYVSESHVHKDRFPRSAVSLYRGDGNVRILRLGKKAQYRGDIFDVLCDGEIHSGGVTCDRVQ